MIDATEVTAREVASAEEQRRKRRSLAILLIVAFWTAQFLLLSLRGQLSNINTMEVLLRRFAVALFGALACFALFLLLERWRNLRLPARIGLGLAATISATLLLNLVNFAIFRNVGKPHEKSFLLETLTVFTERFWFILACVLTFTVLSYSFDLRESSRRVERLRALTQEAQLRALHYQINPHFLYNSLNSVAALIRDAANAKAEALVLGLATFFRATTQVDPASDVPLREELRLQQLYLDVERVRFGDRLKVRIEIPEPLLEALVPALLLQPLIENAVKHGVARRTASTTIRIGAEAGDRRLKLVVENDLADDGNGDGSGTRIGLANLAARLTARFGNDASVRAGADDGRFLVRVTLPLLIAGADRVADHSGQGESRGRLRTFPR